MTPTEYRAAVLMEMAVTAAGETASGTDDTAVTTAYARLHAELVERGKVWWNVDDDVPDSAGDAMIWILASRMARGYGLPPEDRAELYAKATEGHKILADVGHEGEVTAPTDAVYY